MINVFTKIESVKKISYLLFFLACINLFSNISGYQKDEIISNEVEVFFIDFEEILSDPFIISPKKAYKSNDN